MNFFSFYVTRLAISFIFGLLHQVPRHMLVSNKSNHCCRCDTNQIRSESFIETSPIFISTREKKWKERYEKGPTCLWWRLTNSIDFRCDKRKETSFRVRAVPLRLDSYLSLSLISSIPFQSFASLFVLSSNSPLTITFRLINSSISVLFLFFCLPIYSEFYFYHNYFILYFLFHLLSLCILSCWSAASNSSRTDERHLPFSLAISFIITIELNRKRVKYFAK